MFYSTNQSYHWKLNQAEVAIYGRLCNQIVRRGVTSFTSASEQYIRCQNHHWHSGLLIDHDDVHLWEMRQRIYREEKPDQTPKDPCSFLTDLFLWGMQQSVQLTRPQKQTWSGPQLQLDLRSMWSVLQQTGQPSTPSCPARETRGQAETTDEETSSTWSRTQPKAATYRVTTNKYPPRKEPSCSRYGGSTWRPRDPCPIFKTLEYHSDRGSDRYNFALHEMTASTFTEMVHQIFREQTTAFKINVSFGFSLRHMETGELRYYHSSQNNSRFLMFHTSSEQKKTWRNF